MEDDFQEKENECGRDAYAPLWVPAAPKTFLSWMELRSHAGGAVEVAFDHDNSDIIMETYVAAEVCRAVKDIDREPFCREGRTISHDRGKALQAEFFAKPVLCLSDSIGVENQHVAAGKV